MPERNAPASLASDITVERVNHAESPKAGRYRTQARESVEKDLNAPDIPASDISIQPVGRNKPPLRAADPQKTDGLSPEANIMAPVKLNNISDLKRHSIQDVVSRGSITLGDKKYSVTVVNDKVQVNRQGLDSLSAGARLGNGVKDFFDRLFSEGSLSTRSSRLEDQLQGMMKAKVDQHVGELRSGLRDSQEFLQQHHTLQNFTEASVQCMSDAPTTQQFLRENLNNPAFNRDSFTGIQAHPTDPKKFIATFGEQQIEFSNRDNTNFELRGELLKRELSEGNYQNLGELISRNHLTEKDSLLIYSLTPPVQQLSSRISEYPPAMRNQIIDTIFNEPIGNTTVGRAVPNLLTRGPMIESVPDLATRGMPEPAAATLSSPNQQDAAPARKPAAERQIAPENLDSQRQRSASTPADPALEASATPQTVTAQRAAQPGQVISDAELQAIADYGPDQRTMYLQLREELAMSHQDALDVISTAPAATGALPTGAATLGPSGAGASMPNVAPLQAPASIAAPVLNRVAMGSFGADTPVSRQNNTMWQQATKTGDLAPLANHVHVPIQGSGFCFLTALAASRGVTTPQLIEQLKTSATGNATQTATLARILNEARNGSIDPEQADVTALLASAGIAINVHVFAEDGAHIMSPAPSSNAVDLMFRKGHFDLLMPAAGFDPATLASLPNNYVLQGTIPPNAEIFAAPSNT